MNIFKRIFTAVNQSLKDARTEMDYRAETGYQWQEHTGIDRPEAAPPTDWKTGEMWQQKAWADWDAKHPAPDMKL